MMFSIKDFSSKCDQIPSFLRVWSHLLKKSLMENFIFCAVLTVSLLYVTLSMSPTFPTISLLYVTISMSPTFRQFIS